MSGLALLLAAALSSALTIGHAASNLGWAPTGYYYGYTWDGYSLYDTNGSPYSKGNTHQSSGAFSLRVVHWAWDGSNYVQYGPAVSQGYTLTIENWTTLTTWVNSDHSVNVPAGGWSPATSSEAH
jgi:hypothetical protein